MVSAKGKSKLKRELQNHWCFIMESIVELELRVSYEVGLLEAMNMNIVHHSGFIGG